MVDDQAGKLLSYEVMLGGLGEKLIKAASAKEALEVLLKTDIAVVLMDVSMPELDGFQLAAMIRQPPAFSALRSFLSPPFISPTWTSLKVTSMARWITFLFRWFRNCCARKSECSPICTERRGCSKL